jgi:Flp pilus assembly secretin CpaC
VCGLFRPVILLPRALAERLPPKQLRAVLLHELLHLRRGDVWVNCAQALLQIAYWWHPLLWLANARIRRLRQEAVDDAVMLALNKDADAYAPTLLEVAKLALHRPLASLGLVGILESRSSLRQRIERLVDFHPPRRAGLTLGSGVALFGFAALALPMGEAPAPSKLAPPESAAMPNGSTLLATTNTAPLDLRINAATLVQDGKLLFEMGKLTEAEAKLKLALKAQPRNEAALYYLNLVSEAKFAQAAKGADTLPVPSPYARTNLLRTAPGRQAIISKLDHIRLGSVSFDGLPLGEVLRTLSEETRKRDPEKRGINFLVAQNAPNAYNSGYSFIPALDTNRQSELAPPPAQPEVADTKIKISPPLTDIRLADVLDAIVKVADRPIKYAIEDYAIVFSLRQHEPNPLYVRTFKVDPKTVLEALQPRARQAERNGVELAARDARDYFAGGPEGVARAEREAVTRPLRDYFARLGVDLDPVKNPGKAIFFNDRQGMIIVRATMQDLDIIETAIQTLNVVPPQINIKARFVEVPEEDSKALGFDWYLGNVLMTNSPTGGQVGIRQPPGNPSNAASPGGVFPGAFPAGTNGQALTSGLRPVGSGSPLPAMTGILTEPQYRVVLRALEQRAGTDLVAQPEVTVINGRQAQCKAVDVRTIVEGIDPRALTPPGITSTNDADSSALATESMEFGPTLDVTPSVLPDGHTINLPLTASLLEFLGYEDNRTNLVTVYVNGKQKQVSPPRPIVRIAQITSQANVWDGQTLVLGGLVSERVVTTKDSVPGLGNLPLVGRLFRSESKNAQKRKLLVFITPTIIDPAGNRVHSDEEMPSTRQAIPQQPSR